MTRHRRDDNDGLDGDAPWRAKDYGRARPPDTPGDYPAPWDGPAGATRPSRGALGTSSGRDNRPGAETSPRWEHTSPPWELPGWDEPGPAQRRPRDDSAHPSGPLPQVSGPLPRLSPGAWPPAVSGPLPPVPGEAWPPPELGYAGTRRAGSQDDIGYVHAGAAGPGYAGAGSWYGGDTGADYAERNLPGTGFARGEYPSRGGGAGDAGYPGPDPDYDDPGYHDSFPPRAGHSGDDYEPGYSDEPGYSTGPGYSAGSGYPDEPGYQGEGYHDEGDYPGGDYPDEPGYAEPGYARDDDPGQSGYPGPDPDYDDTGYHAADDYSPGHDQAQSPRDRYGLPLRDDPDDHEYGDTGGWYGGVDEDRGWGDEEYDSGVLPGFSGETGYQRAPGRGPATAPPRPDRGGPGRGGPDRPRGGKPKPKPKRKSAMRRAAGWIALTVLVTILAAAGVGVYLFWRNYLHPPDYSGPGTGNVLVQVKSGETATQVGQQLVNLGVVASVRAFSNAAKASGHGSSLEPGYYRLHKRMSAALAFALLLKPSSRAELTVTVPEGLRLSSIITVLGKHLGDLHGYQQAIKDTSALGLPSYAHGKAEGYLFPATYTVPYGTTPLHVLQMMVQRYDQEASRVNLPAGAAHGQISEHDAIIVASLVQAEGRRAQDFPKIARVIYNRLNIGMALQLDSTVMYALHTYGIRATSAQTKINSPYNTYKRTGLPPTPIDSPGETAIKAALHPAAGHRDWLYFLTVNPKTGLTKFTSSFTQFQAYVAELNANLAKEH